MIKVLSKTALAWLLPFLLLAAETATATDLIPAKTFNTSDWTSGLGFQACSGGSGYRPCIDGSGVLTFAYASGTVSRSFAITPPVSSASFMVNVRGYSSALPTDSGEVYLRAFNAGNQLLAEKSFSDSALDDSVRPVKLLLTDAGILATATRIEVTVSGVDSGGWSGNYGSIFSGPQLFINDMDGDGLEDGIDADADGDGVIDRIQVSASRYATCALDNTGVHCWGDTDQSNMPTLNAPTSVSTGYHTCALDADGVHCWGNDGNGQTAVPELTHPRAVSAGGFHTCALDDAGVHCWGYNYNGQTTVPALNQPTAVSAGYLHTCAIDVDGVHCWGDNTYGKATVPVTLVAPVAVVSTSSNNTCALDANGVHCWGSNDYGQLDVPALSNPVAVAVGDSHSCALDDTGVHCWGNNSVGQIDIPTLDQPQSISVGAHHSCAVDKTGVHCWGYNSSGQSVVPTTLSSGDNCLRLANADQLNTDEDSFGDACDPDIDGDGVENASDVFPLDATETIDSDSDGTGDNADTDDDNDGTADENDAFPLDADESVDTDHDGIGNNADADDDDDGVLDEDDVFPLDDTETEDDDGDNIGNNGDQDDNDANMLRSYLGSLKTDKAGSSVAFAGDFNGDGYGDYVIGIPGYDVPATSNTKIIKDAGRAVVISGKNGEVLKSIDGAVAKDAMGFAVAGGGDIDHDGFDDVVIGAPYADHLPLKDTGSVTVLFGSEDESGKETIYGTEAKSLFGSAVALGNVNDDVYVEVIVGEPKADDLRGPEKKRVDTGRVTVYSDNDFTVPVSVSYGSLTKAYFGTSVSAGDFDGDGKADIIVGAPNDDDLEHKLSDAGSVSVFTSAETPLLKEYGAVAKAYLGKSVASGYVNNDDYADVVVGAPGDDTPATPSAKKISDTGSVTVFSGIDNSQLTKKYGTTAKAGLGNSVATGDVNNDGNADIIAGASKDDSPTVPKTTKDTGSVFVWSGSNYNLITTKYGDAPKDAFGTSVSAGDINSDGKADLIIGIPGFDIPVTKPVKDTGAVQVVSGASL